MPRHDTSDPAMMASEPMGTWLPKEEAAKLIGVSVRQLQRLAIAGYIRKLVLQRGPRERTAPVVYSREDCEAKRDGRGQSYGEALPAAEEIGPTAIAVVRQMAPPPFKPDWDAFCHAVAGALAPRAEAKPWLTLGEAVEYSGLPMGFLRKVAKEGGFGAIDVAAAGASKHAWRFRRAAF